MKVKAEYIWLDGKSPTQEIRSKTKVLTSDKFDITTFSEWGFDGSSTEQATGGDSDCILKPVFVKHDPLRKDSYLVLCEVLNADGTPHETNYRHKLVEAANKYKDQQAWFGIEQEYFMLDSKNIGLGWPEGHYRPQPQGKYYCSVGADRAYGREIAEAHLEACLEANLEICGINAEVAPGQWEFQIGPLSPVETADQLWIARYLLNRVAEDFEVTIALDPKPYTGEWNGTGAHTNFSTKAMREEDGIKEIQQACVKLQNKHAEHMANYGAGNRDRMTGLHETCDYDTFKFGNSDRGCSIRIPIATRQAQKGYMEDRRPAGNADPYRVCQLILETVCGE